MLCINKTIKALYLSKQSIKFRKKWSNIIEFILEWILTNINRSKFAWRLKYIQTMKDAWFHFARCEIHELRVSEPEIRLCKVIFPHCNWIKTIRQVNRDWFDHRSTLILKSIISCLILFGSLCIVMQIHPFHCGTRFQHRLTSSYKPQIHILSEFIFHLMNMFQPLYS